VKQSHGQKQLVGRLSKAKKPSGRGSMARDRLTKENMAMSDLRLALISFMESFWDLQDVVRNV
jgi:hypothetical protein